MKIFLATYKIFEGERSDYKKLLIKAETKEDAEKIGESQEHDAKPKNKSKKLTWFDYGDGSTIAVFKGVQEISKKEADIFHKDAEVNYFDPNI